MAWAVDDKQAPVTEEVEGVWKDRQRLPRPLTGRLGQICHTLGGCVGVLWGVGSVIVLVAVVPLDWWEFNCSQPWQLVLVEQFGWVERPGTVL